MCTCQRERTPQCSVFIPQSPFLCSSILSGFQAYMHTCPMCFPRCRGWDFVIGHVDPSSQYTAFNHCAIRLVCSNIWIFKAQLIGTSFLKNALVSYFLWNKVQMLHSGTVSVIARPLTLFNIICLFPTVTLPVSLIGSHAVPCMDLDDPCLRVFAQFAVWETTLLSSRGHCLCVRGPSLFSHHALL